MRPGASRGPVVALAFAASLAASLVAREAFAHELGLSRGDYVTKGDDVDVVLAFARREALSLDPSLDGDRDGALTDAEVTADGTALARRVFDGVVVEADGKPCAPKPAGARLVAEDGIEVFGAFACTSPTAGAALTVQMPLLESLSTGHRHLVKLSHGGKLDEAMLHKKEPSLSVKGGAPQGDTSPSSPATSPSAADAFVRGAVLVLTGRGHPVSLFGFALLAGFGDSLFERRRLRGVVAAVLALTVTQAFTMSLGVFGVARPSPTLIEPLIGLAVAYIGVENLLSSRSPVDPSNRWRVLLPFGLVHGFSLAAALAAAGLPGGSATVALMSLGVGAAQLVVLALLVFLAFLLTKRPWFRAWGIRVGSVVVIALGLYWFVRHVLG